MTDEQKMFVMSFGEKVLKPAQDEATHHLSVGNACWRTELYNFLKDVQYQTIGDGGFRIEFILYGTKFSAIYAERHSTLQVVAYLKIIEYVMDHSYSGYKLRAGKVPTFYRGIIELQKIVAPGSHS